MITHQDVHSPFFELAHTRRSIRLFLEQPVEEEKLQEILEAANSAPSAGNLQAYEIIIARDTPVKRALAHAALDQDFISIAPVILVFCANPGRSAGKYGTRGRDLYSVQDATIACAYAQLAATALDLGNLWVGAFHPDQVTRVLHLSNEWLPIALLPIGYPAELPNTPGRRPLNEIVHECNK